MERRLFGAEAFVVLDKDSAKKVRPAKAYRISVLDERLRRLRTGQEVRILQRLRAQGLPVPRVISERGTTLTMERMHGKRLRDVLNARNYKVFSRRLGQIVAKIHNLDIIHGDLTTSNVIVGKELSIIDFGLSFHSKRVEDKAVDLHLLKRALCSRHWAIADDAFEELIKVYSHEATDAAEILQRLEVVEKRGRYKSKRPRKGTKKLLTK